MGDILLCPKCGAENPAGAAHCANCRVNLRLASGDAGEIERAREEAARREQAEAALEASRPRERRPRRIGYLPAIGAVAAATTVFLAAGATWFFSWETLSCVSLPALAAAALGAVLGAVLGRLACRLGRDQRRDRSVAWEFAAAAAGAGVGVVVWFVLWAFIRSMPT